MKKYLIYILNLLLIPFFANAQGVDNLLRSNGRIYVVIGVILIIFIIYISYSPTHSCTKVFSYIP